MDRRRTVGVWFYVFVAGLGAVVALVAGCKQNFDLAVTCNVGERRYTFTAGGRQEEWRCAQGTHWVPVQPAAEGKR